MIQPRKPHCATCQHVIWSLYDDHNERFVFVDGEQVFCAWCAFQRQEAAWQERYTALQQERDALKAQLTAAHKGKT